MKKIYLIHDSYNWDSYSIVRSMYEVLKEREDVELISTAEPNCQLWLYSSYVNILQDVYQRLKRDKIFIVTFGLSDPNMFDARRLATCNIYCSNDFNTSIKHPKIYHFPYGVDLKYFKKIKKEKTIDVLFVGTLRHPYIPIRYNYIQSLNEEKIKFESYGQGFNKVLIGEKLIEAYCKAHLNLDICTEVSSLASRIFQAAACGTPTLTLKRNDILKCFEDGKEILTYTGGYTEMMNTLKAVLKDKSRLAKIGENARKRCMKDHGIRNRVDNLIKYLEVRNESC